MAKEKNGPAKRYGVRYGRTSREKAGKIETLSRKLHKCPQCSKDSVKRVSMGIWSCRKCGTKFAGQAYMASPRKLKGAREEVVEEYIEEVEAAPQEATE